MLERSTGSGGRVEERSQIGRVVAEWRSGRRVRSTFKVVEDSLYSKLVIVCNFIVKNSQCAHYQAAQIPYKPVSELLMITIGEEPIRSLY